MKIFDSETGFNSKVNFVDENNVFVGYDTYQDCCEHASWIISEDSDFSKLYSWDTPDENLENEPEHISEYSFDPDFCSEGGDESLDGGGFATFRLVANGRIDLFLHIFNSHNGYYGHGFTFGIGENIKKEDYL